MENNHQSGCCNCNKEDKNLEILSLLPILMAFSGCSESKLDKFNIDKLNKLELRISLLEDEINKFKKFI